MSGGVCQKLCLLLVILYMSANGGWSCSVMPVKRLRNGYCTSQRGAKWFILQARKRCRFPRLSPSLIGMSVVVSSAISSPTLYGQSSGTEMSSSPPWYEKDSRLNNRPNNQRPVLKLQGHFMLHPSLQSSESIVRRCLNCLLFRS